MAFFAAFFILGLSQQFADTIPIKLHPDNPHYFEFRGEPTVLVTSGEHYSSALNTDFDYIAYLNELEAKGLNYSRLFTGTFVYNESGTPLTPDPDAYITPWARSDTDGYRGGGNLFDLDTWDNDYFERLHDIVAEAGDRGIVLEITFFCVNYDNQDWWNSPLSSVSNINGVGTCDRKHALTTDNGNLLDYQKGMITKIVTELEGYDNIFYEIINEPYLFDADNPSADDPELSRKYVHMDWQREMSDAFDLAQQDFSNKYLLAQNIDQFKTTITENEGKLTDVIDHVSIFNFHYNARTQNDINTSIGNNYHLNMPICCDETGNNEGHSEDVVYRRQGWNFLMGGGAMYNNLDYTFQVDYPDGDQENDRTNSGGGVGLRTQLGILKSYFDSFDFVNMEPYHDLPASNSPVAMYQPLSIGLRCLANTGTNYVLYTDEEGLSTITLNLPENEYVIVWSSPKDGTELDSDSFSHSGGEVVVSAPSYTEDLVVRVYSNAAPVVNAGSNANIDLPVSTYTLQGSVTDDGLPENSSVTISWTLVSGSGTVTFDDASSPTAIATFSQAGTYTLRLTATDGELTSQDNVIIFVNSDDPPPPSQSTVLAHWDLDELSGTVSYDNTTQNNNGDLMNGFNFDDSSVGGHIATALSFNGSTDFINMGDPGSLDMGYDNFSLSSWIYIPEHQNAKQFIIIKAADGSKGYGLRINKDNTVEGIFNSTNTSYYCGDVVPDENQWNHVAVVFDRTNNIFHIYLNGVIAGSTDIPDGTVSNNKDFRFGSYLTGGLNKRFFKGYLDDVKIYDHALTVDEILDIMNPPSNSAPTVDAGINQSIQLPSGASLSGTANDDGLPNNSLTTTWSMYSGPGTVTFGNVNQLNTTATFSDPGLYVLSLFADDGNLTAIDNINITVGEEEVSNLIGHWKFDETTGTIASDETSNQNDGSLELMSFDDNAVNGQYNNALSFNGVNEYINIGDPSDGSLDMGVNDFTLSTWIFIPEHQNTKQYIIVKAIDGSKGYGIRIDKDNSIHGVFNSSSYNIYCGDEVPTENEWHHIAVVFDRVNGEFQLFLDGQPTGSTNIGGGTINNNQDLQIGAYKANGVNKRFFAGYVDDIRIYDYALAESEVQNLYSPFASAFGGGGSASHNEEEERLVSINTDIENEYSIINYPNPFTNQTTISFSMKESSMATVKVFNTLGMEVQTLFNEMALAGREYKITFNANDLPEGIYFYTLQSGEEINSIKKMILFR